MTQPLFTDEEWEAADERKRKRQELLVEAEKAQVRNVADVQAREQAPQRAEALHIEKRTQVPYATVERNLDEMRARDAYQQLGPVRAENSPAWGTFLNGPLAPIALQNPENTRAIADAIDWRTVGSPRQGSFGAGVDQGLWMTQVANLAHAVKWGRASATDEVKFDRLWRNSPPVHDAPGYFDDFVRMVGSQVPVQGSIFAHGLAGGAAGGTGGATVATVPALGATLTGVGAPAAPLIVKAGAGIGAAAGFKGGTAYGSYHLEGGLAYVEMLGEAERVYQETGEVIPHEAIFAASEFVGVVNGALEFVSFNVMFGNPFLGALKRKLFSKAGLDIIKSKTLRPYLMAFGKRVLVSAGTEAATEFSQEQVVMGMTQALIASTTSLEAEVPEDWFERTVKSTLAGLALGPVMTTAAAPYHAAVMRVGMNKQTRAKEQMTDALVEAVRSGELSGADPDALRSWLQGMLEEGGGDPNLYVPPENLVELFQQDESLGDAMPGVLEQLAEALATGGDVVVPMADYVTYLGEHHEALKGAVRHGLGERNMAEVEATEAEDEAALQAELEALAGEGAPVAEEAEGEEAAPLTPGERVAEAFSERLASESIHSSQDVGIIAELLKRVTEVRAADPAIGERAFEEADIQVEGPRARKPTLEKALDRIGLLDLIGDIRKGRTPEDRVMKTKHPVLNIIRNQGGIATVRQNAAGEWERTTLAGELAAMDITPKTFPGLFRDPRKARGNRPAPRGEVDAFDFTESGLFEVDDRGHVVDVNDVLEAISEEVAGRPRPTREEAEEMGAISQPRLELERVFSELGIDPEVMTDEEILESLSRYIPEAPDPAVEEVSLDEDDDPFFQTLNTLTQPTLPPGEAGMWADFAGAGTVEAALEGVVGVGATEYDPAIIAQHNEAHGTNYTPADVNEVSPEDIAAADPFLYEASPVCKNFSKAKRLASANDLDRKSAETVARVIRVARPPTVVVENVPAYADTALLKKITDSLDAEGYAWDVVIHDAADYGAPMTRERMIIRAVRDGDLPPLPEKSPPGDWWAAIEDLVDGAPDAPFRGKTDGAESKELAGLKRRMELFAKSGGRQGLDPDQHIITMGGWAAARNPGKPAPTLKATPREVPRILMSDGTVKRVTPRMMARLMGLPDSYPVPEHHGLAKTVLGNGVHGATTRALIQPLVDRSKSQPPAPQGDFLRSLFNKPPPVSAERVARLKEKRAALIERGFPARMFLGPEPVEVTGISSGGRKDAPPLEPTLENLDSMGGQVNIRDSNGESAIALVDQLEFAPTPRAEATTLGQPARPGTRGSLTYAEDLSKTVLTLSESENLSTALHELGHLFFVMMVKDAQTEGVRPELQRDMETALNYLGASSVRDLIKDPETGQLSEQGREFHERWARSFEAYLREGKAPIPELRDAFRRFRSWLIEVYRQIRGLNVELSDDIRGVFDRLLATEEAIAAAAASSPAQRAFESQEQSGLSDAEYAAYEKSFRRISDEAEERLIAQVLREEAQAEIERAGNRRDQAREQAEVDVRARPVAQLRYWLQRGETIAEGSPAAGLPTEGRKLDTARVAQILGRSTKDVQRVMGGTGQYGMTQHGGQEPGIVAELWGFSSAEAMIRALYDSSGIEQEIEAETERRLRQGQGDPLRDGSIHARAQEAIDGDAKASFLMRQLSILGHRAGIAKNLPQKVLKDAAERIIDGKAIRDIRPGLYRAAEARASQEVLDAVAAQDWAAAHAAGRQQLLNHYLAKQAEAMKAESEKWRRFWSDFNKKALRKRLAQTGSGYLEAADSLLDRFDIRQLSNKQANINLGEWMMSILSNVDAYNKALNGEDGSTGTMLPEPQFAFRELAFDTEYRKHWRMLTVAEAKELTAALSNIKHLALRELTIKLENEEREFLAVRNEATAQITKTRRKFKPPPIGARNDPAHTLHSWAANYLVDHRKPTSLLHEMDGGYDGIMTRLIVHPMDASHAKEEAMLLDAGEKLQALFAPYIRSGFFEPDAWKRSLDMGGVVSLTAKALDKKSPLAPRITDKKLVPGTANIELSHLERIMAVMNMGNAGNMQRLEDGYHWNREEMRAILATMQKPDMDFIQGVWDFIETYWEEIAAIEKRRTGVKPEKVKAIEIQTPFGTYRGGYFPAVYDGDQLAIATTNTDTFEAYQDFLAAQGRTKTQDSFTKARARKVKNRPMRLDFDVIFRHVGDVIHRLSFEDWAVNTGKLLADQHMAQTILEMYGPEVWRAIKDWHADVVRGEGQGVTTATERLSGYFRTGMAVSSMGMNLGTSILQPWGLFNALKPSNLGPKWVAKGFQSWWRDFDSAEGQAHMIRTIRHIREVSPTMRNRLSAAASNTREMREVASQLNKEGVLGPVRSKFFLPIIMMQATVDIPIWLGAYAKEMQTGSGEESKAIAMADRMVINTQGSGRIGDLSGAQRQQKVLTLFMSFMNTVNDQAALDIRWARSGNINPMKLALGLASLYMPYVFTKMMQDFLRDSWDEEEDDPWPLFALKYGAGAIAGGYFGGFTVIREGTGMIEGFDYRGPAALGIVPKTAAAVKVLLDEDPIDDRGVTSLIMATSVVARVPGVQPKRWYELWMEDEDIDLGTIVYGPRKD